MWLECDVAYRHFPPAGTSCCFISLGTTRSSGITMRKIGLIIFLLEYRY
jgi:hypothetical protein